MVSIIKLFVLPVPRPPHHLRDPPHSSFLRSVKEQGKDISRYKMKTKLIDMKNGDLKNDQYYENSTAERTNRKNKNLNKINICKDSLKYRDVAVIRV